MSSSKAQLDVRAGWQSAPEGITPATLDEWCKGLTLNVLPSESRLAAKGIKSILTRWAPEPVMVGRQARVIGVGSCFASYFLLWLGENGFNRDLDGSPQPATSPRSDDSPARKARRRAATTTCSCKWRRPSWRTGGAESAARVADLGRRAGELPRVAYERMKVIEGLDRAARERLEVAQRRHGECEKLRLEAARRQ
jgi:hypothetical protein